MAKRTRKASTAKVTGYKLTGKLETVEASKAKPVDERDGATIGLANGLRLTWFLNELYVRNYRAKLTDEQLDEATRAEYPAREVVQPPSNYRGYFNNGKHGHGAGDNTPLPLDRRLPRFVTDENGKIVAKVRGAGSKAKASKAPSKAAKAKAPSKAPATRGKVRGVKRPRKAPAKA